MTEKKILFDSEAREKLKLGVDKLANAVKVTMGAKGRNVVIEKKFGSQQVTKDGVTVAKDIELSDPFENVGAQMVKEVASKTADNAGDGTTTATVLAQAIVNVGLKNVTAGANPMDLKRGIDKGVAKVIEHLKKQTVSVGDDYQKIEQVATISANNDNEIGKLIAEAMKKVKKEGVITVEEAKGIETTVEVVEGMQFDRGYISPYFITDNDNMEVVLEKPYILIADKKISTLNEIVVALEFVARSASSILIISDNIEGEALSTLVVNKMRGSLKVCAVKSPSFGDHKRDILDDIATITGSTVVSNERGTSLDNLTVEMLGRCDKVIIKKDSTVIVNGHGKSEEISNRVNQLKSQIELSENNFEKIKYKERLAKILGGIAVLYVGAATETEMKEKKDRVDDALNATRAAVEEGIIPGGGVAFIRATESLDGLKGINDDETTGILIVKRAIEEPLRQIVANAGMEGSVIVQKVKEGKDDYGYNVTSESFEHFFTSGVIDPTKVARVALENAASIAGLILTTDCLIASETK